jgi:selenide,water dikinase
MGGTPLMAIGILGWPIDKLSPQWATKIIEGAQSICASVKIPLAGGHSIDNVEPIFGLAVTGRVDIKNLKKNGGAKAGDLIYLTKGLGVGILTTAGKKSLLKPEHYDVARISMLKMNTIGEVISKYPQVHALTDVTGFGLAGHLLEMCEAADLSAQINYVKLPVLIPEVYEYIQAGAVPGGTHRNWNSYGSKINLEDSDWKFILADPQTSGGLLIAIDPSFKSELESILKEYNLESKSIGVFQSKNLNKGSLEVLR